MHILENIGSIYELETSSYVTGVEIKSRVSQKTKYMIENGISCGSRVVITIENSVEFFVNLFSLWAIGAVAIPISEKSTNSEIDSVTKGLFAIAKITVTGLNLLKSDEAKKSKDTGFQPDKPCLILMSSGTTGVSKGIEFSFLQILNKMNTFNLRYGNAYERTLCFLPTSFGHGLIANCLTPLLNGKDLFLSKRFNFQIALSLEEILIHHKISLFSTVPSMWNLIQKAQVPPPAKLFLSQVHCASAFLHKNTYDFIRSWIGNTSFYYHYGLTECGSWITEAQLPIDCDLYKFGYVGKPLDCEILVKNQDQSGSGQVVVRSNAFPKQYRLKTGETKEIFEPSEGFLYTGDIGIIDSNGLYLIGRQSDFINRGGEKISPSEIEAVVANYKCIELCSAFATPHPILGEVVGLAIQINDKEFDIIEFKKYLTKRMSSSKMPSEIFVFDQIELSSNGKIDRNKLQAKIKQSSIK